MHRSTSCCTSVRHSVATSPPSPSDLPASTDSTAYGLNTPTPITLSVDKDILLDSDPLTCPALQHLNSTIGAALCPPHRNHDSNNDDDGSLVDLYIQRTSDHRTNSTAVLLAALNQQHQRHLSAGAGTKDDGEMLDPTETDMTETTRTEDEDCYLLPPSTGFACASAQFGIHIPQMQYSVADLIQKLQSVTQRVDEDLPDESESRRSANVRSSSKDPLLTVEELTLLLSELNESQQDSTMHLERGNYVVHLCQRQQPPQLNTCFDPELTMSGCSPTCDSVRPRLDRAGSDLDHTQHESLAGRQQQHPVALPSAVPAQTVSPPNQQDHAPLLPLSELIDRLHQINAREEQESSAQQKSKMQEILQRKSMSPFCLPTQQQQQQQQPWSVAEMTRMLHRINNFQIAMPAVQQQEQEILRSCSFSATAKDTGGRRTNANSSSMSLPAFDLGLIGKDDDDDDAAFTVPIPRRRNSSLLSINCHKSSSCQTFLRSMDLPSNRNFSWTDDEDDEPSHYVTVSDNNVELSLAPEDLFDPQPQQDHDHESTGSGFSLFVLQSSSWGGGGYESTDSSITWYEGSDIEEITVNEDSPDEENCDDSIQLQDDAGCDRSVAKHDENEK